MSRKPLTREEAIELLPTDKYVHTFRQGVGPGMMLLGADCERGKLVKAIEEFGAELSGETATSMGHGIVLQDSTGLLFIETKPEHEAGQ